VLGDTFDESNETFFVNLSAPTGATIADGQGVGTIVDDDASPPPVPPLIAGPCSDHGTLGDDEIMGDSAPNWICGWRGADTLRGLGGADRLLGGDGDDLLDGGLGPDDLDGGFGNDVIDAFGEGADAVDGGAGFDTCYCGPEDSMTGIELFIPHGK
jgi:Ca2+-binding RTX toxin-like protein